MLKFMKYEIKGSYKYISGIIILTFLLNLANFGIMRNSEIKGTEISVIGGLFIGISFIVIFGIMLGTFLYIVNLYKKELYENRGFLTFTLPISGRKILGAKVLVAFFWFTLISIGFVLSNIAGAFLLIPKEFMHEILNAFKQFQIFFGEVNWFAGIAGVIFSIFSIILTLLMIYFSMAIGRISLKNKKLTGIWFIIFVILTIIAGYIELKIGSNVPYYFTFENSYSINIGVTLFNILLGLGLFFGTSYLMENKIDL